MNAINHKPDLLFAHLWKFSPRLLLTVLLCGGLIFLTFSSATSSFAVTLPDTGQTKCYDTSGGEIDCKGTGQDGEYSTNPIGYTDNRNGTITDNVTNLMWQKLDDGVIKSWALAGTYCDTSSLGGYSDWRLPSKRELISIVNYSLVPFINSIYFPNTNTDRAYWSSSPFDSNAKIFAWAIDFGTGEARSYYAKKENHYVRCVRGETSFPSFTDNGSGTVTDNGTALMWEQSEGGQPAMSWPDALLYCNGLSLAGKSDWRLPDIKELESITDDTKHAPSIDPIFFPNTGANYWSSTSMASNAMGGWFVGLSDGSVSNIWKPAYTFSTRCVRSVVSGAFGYSDIRANGSNGPITISHTTPLTITVSLNAGGKAGQNADRWALVYTPFGWYHHNAGADTWEPGLNAAYQGELSSLATQQILNVTGLPAGTYTFFFGVDMTMNGMVDGELYYDSVEVTINP